MGPSQGPEGPHQFKAGWKRSKLWEKLRRAGQRGREGKLGECGVIEPGQDSSSRRRKEALNATEATSLKVTGKEPLDGNTATGI